MHPRNDARRCGKGKLGRPLNSVIRCHSMNARGALSSLAAGGLAGGGALLFGAQWLPSFDPCRILYRAHVPVLDGTACHAYTWFNVAGFVLLSLGFVAGIIVTLQHVRRRSSGT